MKRFILICGLAGWVAVASGQTVAGLAVMNKSESSAAEDQKQIDSLVVILTKKFLQRANDTTVKLNRQIQDFFEEYRMDSRNTAQYNYPKLLTKANLSISIVNFDCNWGIEPPSTDTAFSNGYSNRSLDAIVTIPVYDTYHRGYSINSISFLCKLADVESYKEDVHGNEDLPINKLPGYKHVVTLTTKVVDFDK